MPRVKTLNSEQAWTSPDGKITLYDVVLENEGRSFKTQTYSAKVAQVGFEGEVESYEKNGKKFVKQPPKEGGFNRGGKNDESMYRTSALKNAAEIGGETVEILARATEFYNWLKTVQETTPPPADTSKIYEGTGGSGREFEREVVPEDIPDEINMEDIPF